MNRRRTVNGLNQVTQAGAGAGAVALSYDARGNLTGSGGDSYGYSSENLLKSASVGGSGATVTLSYDPLGRLSAVDGETPRRFLYDGLDLIGEYDAAGTIVQRYVHGPGTDDPLIAFQGASMGNPHFLFKDERGSVILETSKYGDPLTIDSYDEYGIPGADNLGRFQYTGQTWIPELGLYYYKARFYSPTLGRFLQTDPIGYGAGMNIYNYVGGAPVNYSDPLGLAAGCAPISGSRIQDCSVRNDTRNALEKRLGRAAHDWEVDAGIGYRLGLLALNDLGDVIRGDLIYVFADTGADFSLRLGRSLFGSNITGSSPQKEKFAAKPVDYCGAAGSEGVPEGMAATSFQGPCRKHDDCYGTLGKTQEQCDQG